MEAFWDILMLREAGDQKAIPLLAEILADNAGTGRIHGYAAAQALFCIGGKKALVALDKHLLQLDQYNEKLGSMYAFHWDMPEPKRSQYIQAYMLKSIGQDLRLTLDATLEEGGKVRLGFTVKNVSTKPLYVIIPPIHNLYLRSKDGRFLRRHRAHVCEYKVSAGWFRLKSGETRTATGVAVLRQADDLRKHNLQLPKGVQAVLYMADTHYHIAKPGQHQVVFVLEQVPRTREAQDRVKLENPWSGRAVSKPVPLRLATPTTPPGARPPLAARPAGDAVTPDGDPATLP